MQILLSCSFLARFIMGKTEDSGNSAALKFYLRNLEIGVTDSMYE